MKKNIVMVFSLLFLGTVFSFLIHLTFAEELVVSAGPYKPYPTFFENIPETTSGLLNTQTMNLLMDISRNGARLTDSCVNCTALMSTETSSFMDITGDGLPDFIYHQYNFDGNHNSTFSLALFVNTGNADFNLEFVCRSDLDRRSNQPSYYYGCTNDIPVSMQKNSYLSDVLSLAFFNRPILNNGYIQGNYDNNNFIKLVDINGDGLLDFLRPGGVTFNTGNF